MKWVKLTLLEARAVLSDLNDFGGTDAEEAIELLEEAINSAVD
mgnify:CR=1 FL=1